MPVITATPQILHAIVGTAGHVDHGKTSLVKLLTGCDTDRLPEEKARGMSIDLGFAPCVLHGRRLVGIVDVPGHKDFIRNMVAGAASIDVLLLVVAADDGVMPQTDEHMKIVRLLREPLVVVALTKIDLVSPDMLELARQDVAAFLERVGFADAPIIPVSNVTGEGISDIRDKLDELVEQVQHRAADTRAFRMNVERVFSVKGYGTVLTGIPVSGQIHLGEKVELLPAGKELTVRTIQSYKQESQAAFANVCSAINVREIDAEHVARGMTITSPGAYRATTELVISLKYIVHDRPLKRRFEARLHAGTAVADASLKLLVAEQVHPGSETLAHVVLSEPLAIAAGDRLILRAASPAETLGGGVVLSAQPQRFRRHEQLVPRLEAARRAAVDGDGFIAELLAGPSAIIHAADLRRLTQHPPDAAQEIIQRAIENGTLVDLGGGACGVVSRAIEPAEMMRKSLARYHRANPYSWGMSPGHACEVLGLTPRSFDGLLGYLALAGPRFAVKHARLGLIDFKPSISEHLMELREQILAQIRAAGVNGPARGNLMKELNIVERDMRVLTKLLTEDQTVIMLDGNFIFRSVYEECRRRMLALFEQSQTLQIGAFREAIGANRKLAVAMLDAFDVEGLTRRIGDGRVLVRHNPPRPAPPE